MAETDTDVTPQERQEALELGWVDKAEFRGDPEKWIDAKTFLARGRDVMPLLRKNNERLRGENRQLMDKVTKLEQMVNAGQESVKELMKFHEDNVKQKVKEARDRILVDLQTARENEDHAGEAEALGELSRLDATEAAADAVASRIPKDTDGGRTTTVESPATQPWFKAWLDRNPWVDVDKRKTRMANVIAQEMRADPKYADVKEAAFLDMVVEATEKELGTATSGGSRVEGASHSGNTGSGSNGKGFSDLPADAKATCQRQAPKMVGEGRPFKTDKDWHAYYAREYFRIV